jgi:hypothetical protein
MLHILLVFLVNKLDIVRSGDVELLELSVGVFCVLGVDCAPAVLTGVLFVLIYVSVQDI